MFRTTSEQLELGLDDERVTIPWEGLDLRSLTRCGKLFIHRESPTGGLIRVDATQFSIFLKGSP